MLFFCFVICSSSSSGYSTCLLGLQPFLRRVQTLLAPLQNHSSHSPLQRRNPAGAATPQSASSRAEAECRISRAPRGRPRVSAPQIAKGGFRSRTFSYASFHGPLPHGIRLNSKEHCKTATFANRPQQIRPGVKKAGRRDSPGRDQTSLPKIA